MCLLNWGSEQKPYMPVSFVPHCLCCVRSSEFQLYIGRKRVVLDKLSHGLAQKHLPSNMPVLSGYLRKAQVYMWVVISIDLGICTYIYTLTGYCYRQNWLELCLELRISADNPAASSPEASHECPAIYCFWKEEVWLSNCLSISSKTLYQYKDMCLYSDTYI